MDPCALQSFTIDFEAKKFAIRPGVTDQDLRKGLRERDLGEVVQKNFFVK